MSRPHLWTFFFFFNDTATTEIYTLSLHDALPISNGRRDHALVVSPKKARELVLYELNTLNVESQGTLDSQRSTFVDLWDRSEEHTSELQSRQYLVCRLLLEKKKNVGKLVARRQND